MNNGISFLPKELIFGDAKLDILKKYGNACAITDFSILLGGFVNNTTWTNEGTTDKDRAGWWWTRTGNGNNDVIVVDDIGDGNSDEVGTRNDGARPALPYSSISSIALNEVRGSFGIKEVEYGEYPQTIVDESFSRELEENYKRGIGIRKTGRTYTTDSVKYDDYNASFKPREHEEFEYKGRKYIRIIGDYNGERMILSDGRKIVSGEPYWVAVEPIKWLVDEKANIALSKKIIFSGVQFSRFNYHGNINKNDIKMFMDKYFSKEIIQNTNKIGLNNIDLSNIDMTLISPSEIKKNYYLGHTRCSNFAMATGCNFDQNLSGPYWTCSIYSCGVNGKKARIIDTNGRETEMPDSNDNIGIRPVVPYSSIKKNGTKIGENTLLCGEYPQVLADKPSQSLLESLFLKGELDKTGKDYTIFRKEHNNFSENRYMPSVYSEYSYNGKKYVRIRINSDSAGNSVGAKVGDYLWFKVMPVRWIIDEEQDIAISSNILLSGMRYDDPNNTAAGFSFESTEMKSFLNNYMKQNIFSKSIVLNDSKVNEVVEDESRIKRENPYNFNFDEVSEEDIIRGAVESNVSVFLHGRSSEGKSARVKELDPDCEILYMRNATPESLNGKSVYNSETGEMIDVPPTWYTKIKNKCEEEPDKIHIVFFDELTNALPSIQGMAFNIILDGEVNGKWKLPPNARIVAAGNDLKDSLAANQMVEPLFNRFAHVYIETNVDNWLKWASTPDEDYERIDYNGEVKGPKIHPAIYSYIAYKSYSGDDVLRTDYNGEKPNADPRKWEMASKVLTKTNKPEMLRALVGEEITRDFVEFVKQEVITVDDVINHNYNDRDLMMDTSQKFATAVGLSSVSEEHIEEVRLFMKKLGEEPRAAFESMWAHGDRKRLEILAELQLADSMNQGGMTL